MTVTNPSETGFDQLPPVPSPGPFAWLAGFLRNLFGGNTTAGMASSPVSSNGDLQQEKSDFVIAPGGYRVYIPGPCDVHSSVGEMLPSVRKGLDLVPPLPAVVSQLLKEIQDPNASAATVGDIAGSDLAMAASLIRTVNSASFGLTRKITSVSEAVNFLGFTSIKAMVLRLQLELTLGGKNKGNANVEDLWIHSLVVSYIADALAKRVNGVDRGFVATLGLLHDIGKLVVQTQFPGEAKQLLEPLPADETHRTREIRVLGVDHAALGSNLAAKWGMPGDLVKAIRFHHEPERAFEKDDPKPLRQAAAIVQIANQISKYCYVYQDDTEIDAVTDESFDLVGLPHDMTGLLTPELRAAASRAIFFADESSTRPVTSVRRFLRLSGGTAGGTLYQSIAESGAGGEARVEAEDVLCGLIFSENAPPKPGEDRRRFTQPASKTGIENLVRDVQNAHEELPLSHDGQLALTLIARCVLANTVSNAREGDQVELGYRVDGRKVQMAIRSDSLSFERRFGLESDPDIAFAVLDAELANVLNLGWFDSVGTSSDGTTLVFTTRSN